MRLLLGDGSAAVKEGRVATVQSLSGTGSLRVGAAFIQRYFPGKTVYLSNPTWGNHMAIFADAGVPTEMYRYFDADTTGLDFDGMVADLKAAPEGSVVLLHGCAHNPTVRQQRARGARGSARTAAASCSLRSAAPLLRCVLD